MTEKEEKILNKWALSHVKSGECPKCHTTIEDYGTQELLDMQVYYPFTCKKCGFTGREWYDLTFTGFTDDAGNEL
jgi:hypothetical protein